MHLSSSSPLSVFVETIVNITLQHQKDSKSDIVRKVLKVLTLTDEEEPEVLQLASCQTPPPPPAEVTATSVVVVAPTTPTASINFQSLSAAASSSASAAVQAAELMSPVQKPITHEECGLNAKNTKFAPPLPSYLLNEPAPDEEIECEGGAPPLVAVASLKAEATTAPTTTGGSKKPAASASTSGTVATKKAPKALVVVSEPPSAEETIKMIKNNENISFCLRLVSRGQKNGKICGEKPTFGTEYCEYKPGMKEEDRIASIACKKCGTLQQKNPLIKLLTGGVSSSGLSSSNGKKISAATTKKNNDEKMSVASGLPEDLSGLPIFNDEIVDVDAPVAVASSFELEEAAETETSSAEVETPAATTTTTEEKKSATSTSADVGIGSTSTSTSSVDSAFANEIKSLGLEMVPGNENKNFLITKSKLSNDDYRIVIVYSKTGLCKFTIVGRVTKKEYENFISSLPDADDGECLLDILEEVSTEEEALDLLLDNKIIHYRFKNEGDVAVFEEN